jgi:mannonate dehydratase
MLLSICIPCCKRIEQLELTLTSIFQDNSDVPITDYEVILSDNDPLHEIELLVNKFDFENLKYFLERIMPVCDKYDINMAIHPDDPAWSVFGLPRIIINKKNILRMMEMVDNPHNGVTFCSGSYGTNLENDLPDMIRSLKGRIHFAHVRNLKFNSPTDFEEAAHLSSDGTFDMYEIMKALYDIGFDGPIRPDHGRMIWGEVAMPGYGLYDRALGATYLNGLWEAIEKGETRHAVK